MFEKLQRLAKRRTYENYWREQRGTTVRITRGVLEGRRGRLNGANFRYGLVLLEGEGRTCPVVYSDLEVER